MSKAEEEASEVRWEVGVAVMGSLRRMMERGVSWRARRPCSVFATR